MDELGEQTATTPNPAEVIGELSILYGGLVPELTVSRPSLEDIYLKMIGERE